MPIISVVSLMQIDLPKVRKLNSFTLIFITTLKIFIKN